MHLRKIKPDTYFLIAIIAAIAFNFILPVKRIIPDPYTFIGVIIAMAGYLISSKTNTILIRNKTPIQPFEEPTTFISTGPFQYSRNPIYLGMVLILFGLACFFGSLSPFLSPLLFVFFVNTYIIPDEEKQLEELFGKEYRDYKTRVRRWV